MCGIFGYIGPKQVSNMLVEGLRRLEYRGYDSTGIAVKNGNISIFKKVGKVESVVADNGRFLSVVNTHSISAQEVERAHHQAAQQAGVQLSLTRSLHVDAAAPSELKGGWFRLRR